MSREASRDNSPHGRIANRTHVSVSTVSYPEETMQRPKLIAFAVAMAFFPSGCQHEHHDPGHEHDHAHDHAHVQIEADASKRADSADDVHELAEEHHDAHGHHH